MISGALTCPACRVLFEPRGPRPRCPGCGARVDPEAAAAAGLVEDEGLEAPAFVDEAAPARASLAEISAALACLVGAGVFIAGFVLASPGMFMAGFVMVFVVVVGFGIYNWWVRARSRWQREGRGEQEP